MFFKICTRMLACVAALSHGSWAIAQGCTSDAMLVFDGSGSMAKPSASSPATARIVNARRAMAEVMPRVAPFRRIGLLIYGPIRRGGGCADLDVRFGPISDAAEPVIRAVDGLQPEGPTPLSGAVLKAATVLDYTNQPGVVVLVTDGRETCGGSPCYIAEELVRKGVDLTVHVIGFQVRGLADAPSEPTLAPARCVADITGGHYVAADTTEALVQALQRTLGCDLLMQVPGPRLSQSG